MIARRWISLALVLVALLVLAGGAGAQDDEVASLFTVASEEPVIEHGPSGEWDGRYTDPGAVVYHDGLFHMFRNGFRGWVAPVQIGYLTSPDGVTWTEVTEDPVLTTDEVPYAGVTALASSALVEDDGTWVLYFYTVEEFDARESIGRIGRATADSPLGPWTVGDPVLEPGSDGSWDELMVSTPRVLRTDDGYVMYYTGQATGGLPTSQIGMATSPDGVTWTKYDDPATTEPPFAESDPVVPSTNEDAFIHQPNVVRNEDGWAMLYRQVIPARRDMTLWLLHSDDGVTWEPALEVPVWDKASLPTNSPFYFTTLLEHDGQSYLYVEGQHLNGTDIYAATYDGSLVTVE